MIANAGHWLMEEQPAATVAAIHDFLDKPKNTAAKNTAADNTAAKNTLGATALSLEQIQAMPMAGAGTGTSGLNGIRTVLLSGDPAKPGPYALEIHVPPNTAIAAHTHHDDRFATVISGVWYFGYGAKPGDAPVKPDGWWPLHRTRRRSRTSLSRAPSPPSSG